MPNPKTSLTRSISSQPSSWSQVICWSRMQAEGGQSLHDIIHRKELERQANEGLFCWGVGNAPNRCTAGLARSGADVDVLFSIMKSKPKLVDVSPSTTFIWRQFVDYDGRPRPVPLGSLITSRGESATGLKRSHFALFCKSPEPLVLGDFGSFDPRAYRNLGEAGGSIGPSQVTALLRKTTEESQDGDYRINLKAKMFGSYWAKLIDPVKIDIEKQHHLSNLASMNSVTAHEWIDFVQHMRESSMDRSRRCLVSGDKQHKH
jgi:hypothetical protein